MSKPADFFSEQAASEVSFRNELGVIREDDSAAIRAGIGIRARVSLYGSQFREAELRHVCRCAAAAARCGVVQPISEWKQ